jgi:oxaloacetate decarboxylase alpha subunit
MDEVLAEIPKVREDLGFIPLVTPTSQIVGTQSVINVLTGERYKSITKETAGILKGEYGSTPAPMNSELQARVLDGAEPITCRPADVLQPELALLTAELHELAEKQDIALTTGGGEVDDVLTYALFPQIGLKFLQNRGNPDAFEPAPGLPSSEPAVVASPSKAAPTGSDVYTVTVSGQSYVVEVAEGGDVSAIAAVAPPASAAAPAINAEGESMPAPLSGNVFKVAVAVGDTLHDGQVIAVLEAMKMEVEVLAPHAGVVGSVDIAVGDVVAVGDTILTFSK